jgi:hypothetical protein
LSFPCVYFVQHIFLSATSPLRPSFSFHCVSLDVHPFPYESWLLSQYHQLYKGGQTFFFPQAKNRFPIEAKGQLFLKTNSQFSLYLRILINTFAPMSNYGQICSLTLKSH